MNRLLLPLVLFATGISATVNGSCDVEPILVLLPNGMHLVVSERHTSPIVAIDFWVRAGSADELSGENGCAHFLEHTLFKGTTTHGMGAADYDIENQGGVLNAATGADYAHYYTELPSAHIGEATAVIADIVRHATFPDDEVERERAVILDELAKHQSDQFSRIQDRLYTLAFPGKPYELSPGGQPESIRVRARDTLTAFFRRLYIPSRCTLAFAGDVSLEKAKSVAAAMLGDWSGSDIETPASPAASTRASGTDVPAEPGDKEAVGIAFPAPAARNAQQMCLAQVCAALLGNPAEGGRFAGSEWSGAQVAVRYTPHRETSLMTITARMPTPVPPRPFEPALTPPFANLAALQKAILNAVNELSIGPVTESALTAAVNTVRGHLLYDIETDAGLARVIGMSDLLGGETPSQLQARLQQITAVDVQQFAEEWLVAGHTLVVRSRPDTARDPGRQP